MAKPLLVIGNKNYSSWSLRPWLLLKQFKVDFDEVRIPLYRPDSHEKLRQYSPSLKVPVLLHNDVQIWDSLSICEYVSEQFLQGKGWPSAVTARAQARSAAAEMHSGFADLRSNWTMNVRLQRKLPVEPAFARDIARIEELWGQCLQQSGGPFLFGDFSIADAMYAPVVLRFNTYQPPLGEIAQRYVKTILALPPLQEWMAAGRAEAEVISQYEPVP